MPYRRGHSVRGHYRRGGYVQPHWRGSSPYGRGGGSQAEALGCLIVVGLVGSVLYVIGRFVVENPLSLVGIGAMAFGFVQMARRRRRALAERALRSAGQGP